MGFATLNPSYELIVRRAKRRRGAALLSMRLESLTCTLPSRSLRTLWANVRATSKRRAREFGGWNARAGRIARFFRPEPDVGVDLHPGDHLRDHHVGEGQPRDHRAARRRHDDP